VCGGGRAVGLASEGRGDSYRPQTARPRVNPGRLRRVTLAFFPLGCSRPSSLSTAGAVRPGAPKGARLMIVKKILTASTWHRHGGCRIARTQVLNPIRDHGLSGRLWQKQPQSGQPPWFLLDDVTLTTVSEWLDTPAHRQAPGCHRGYAEILARRLPSLTAAGLWLCDESFACYLLCKPAW
jgi:hypothetical protein